uniref:(2E)-enoyl-[ACP] glycyltransferase n=1 Tax=Candidatus Kentrum sp. TUN TaxID=2126343 RepID=A0A450ZHG7_9GAMM|nr:MAG: FcoT-like thioesterase domain-containing protein [Candidatus Kentron sp. TUN]VFK54048.1 MAG: FcoT-like thioesterase domain-containing protein [Candidatus Kentron sp. TUN]
MNTEKDVSLIDIDNAFVRRLMIPYRTHATYLKKATFVITTQGDRRTFSIKGDFRIPISCYIDDTGHFNAVEYNICLNQIGYVFLAHCVKEKLLPEIGDYDLETFIKNQLSNVLIYRLSSKFPRMINAKKFYGELKLNSLKKVGNYTMFNYECGFWDDGDGYSNGSVIAVMPSVGMGGDMDRSELSEDEFSSVIEEYVSTVCNY